jgi:hypothetical protein
MQRRVKPALEGKIEKPEDKAWKEWYDKLDPKEHEEYLSKLGLDKDDIEEWEETEGFKEHAPGELEETMAAKKSAGAPITRKKK